MKFIVNTYFSIMSAMVQANINNPSGNCKATEIQKKGLQYFTYARKFTVTEYSVAFSVAKGLSLVLIC